MSDEEKRMYIAGKVGSLQLVEERYPLRAFNATYHRLGEKKGFNRVSVSVRGTSIGFDAPVRGRIVEWTHQGVRAVCRVADEAVVREVHYLDELIQLAEEKVRALRKERQEIMEAALPRLPVAPVAKTIVDCTEKEPRT